MFAIRVPYAKYGSFIFWITGAMLQAKAGPEVTLQHRIQKDVANT